MKKQINNKQEETKLIVVTRTDISVGYQAQQSIHSAIYFAVENFNLLLDWNDRSKSIICLAIESEQTLLKLQNKLHYKGIESVLFQEPDLNNEYTSLCYYADYESRKLVSHLPLLGKQKDISVMY